MTDQPPSVGPTAPAPIELDGVRVDGPRAAELSLINYGHFTALVVDDLRVQGLDLHLERLVRDSAQIFGTTLDRDRVREFLRQVARACPVPTMLRATVIAPTGSVARPGLPADAPDARPSVLISTRATAPAGATTGLRVRTTNFVRTLPTVKHLGMFGPLHERRSAQLAGFDDALFLTGPEPEARVCEGPTWNVAVLIDDELIWPDDQCLPGVTRAILREAFTPTGITWSSRPVTRADLADVRAAFVTSAAVGVVPITAIDGVTLPGDPRLLDELRATYAQYPSTVL